jgi:hypothetical protein
MSYMAQITICLPDEIEAQARKAARKQHTSVSRWIAEQVTESWRPPGLPTCSKTSSAIPNFPEAEELRRGYDEDAGREPLE